MAVPWESSVGRIGDLLVLAGGREVDVAGGRVVVDPPEGLLEP